MLTLLQIGAESAVALIGLALLLHSSFAARNIVKHVTAIRAEAGLPPVPCRHFVDFAEIARLYVQATGRRTRVTQVYAASTLGAGLLVAGGMLLETHLHLPH
jgi:hypothetical protein